MSDSQTTAIVTGIYKELQRYGATEVIIACDAGGARYRFRTSSGAQAEGKINAKYALALDVFLRRVIANSERITAEGRELSCTLISATEFKVSTHAETSSNVIPLRPIGHTGQVTPASAVPNGRTVLIVEDSPTFSSVLKRFLERSGYVVVQVANGRAALDSLASQSPPALLITDLHMPVMSGDELLKAVRSQNALRTMPVILLSSDAAPAVELAAIEMGADLFFSKTRDPRILCAYIKRLIERSPKVAEAA